jgi:hypothetical protein
VAEHSQEVFVPSSSLLRLAAALGVDVDRVQHLERLGDPVIDGFSDIVVRAHERDAQAIESGLQGTLRFVPRLLRGRAAKLLFPDGE